MTRREPLTDAQRDALVDDMLDYRDLRTDGEYDRDEDVSYLTDLSDSELVLFWQSLIGDAIDTIVTEIDEETEIGTAWDNAEVDGITSPSDWQLDKLLNGEETDYWLPTLANIVGKLIENSAAVTVEHGKLDFLLTLFGMTVDDEGYIRDTDTDAYKLPYSFISYGDPQFQPVADAYHDSEDDPLDERLAATREEQDEPHMHHTDKIHTDEFAGIINPAFLPTSSPQVLVDNSFDMLELEREDAVTTNIKGLDSDTAVLTTTAVHASYEHDANALFGDEQSETVETDD